MGKPANAPVAYSSDSVPPPRPKRKPGQRVPAALKTVVLAKGLIGDSNAQIARDLSMSDNTVAKILNGEEIASLREQGRSGIAGMIPQSVQVFQYHLDRNDKEVAHHVLKGIGVLAPDQQVNVGVFAQGASVDIAGLIGLADDLQANCAPIAGQSEAKPVENDSVLVQEDAHKPDE